MSRRRNLWSGLAAVGIAVALVAGVHYAPGHAPAGSLSVSAAPTVTDQLQDAGLVDGSAINTAAVRKLHAATARGYDRDSFGPPRVPWAPARARRDCSPPASTPTAACRRCTCSRGRTTPSQQPTAPPRMQPVPPRQPQPRPDALQRCRRRTRPDGSAWRAHRGVVRTRIVARGRTDLLERWRLVLDAPTLTRSPPSRNSLTSPSRRSPHREEPHEHRR